MAWALCVVRVNISRAWVGAACQISCVQTDPPWRALFLTHTHVFDATPPLVRNWGMDASSETNDNGNMAR